MHRARACRAGPAGAGGASYLGRKRILFLLAEGCAELRAAAHDGTDRQDRATRRAEWAGVSYPFTAPSVRPRTKSFIENTNRMMIGMEARA